MNFEDIVDMEWVDSSATLDQSNEEFSDLYFNQQLLEQQTEEQPQIKLESLSTMPSTEQIKQLIEIAKQQLALREQLQSLQPDLFTSETEIQTAAPSTIFAPPPPPPPTDTPFMPEKTRRDSIHSLPEESISLEAYAEADGIDLKKLTPKERRQLRNKISARNFRVRRKEYISTLEGQVNEHKQKAEALKEKLLQAEDENKQLLQEMDTLKKQNQTLLQQQQQSSSSSPRIPKLNLNKDISIMGTKASDSYRQHILVSSAVMPAWDYKAILEKPIVPDYHDINKLAGYFILSIVQLAKTMPSISNENAYNMEELYDTLIQSSLLNSNSTADKSFLW